MVNGIGVIAWGVGGIEAEAAILGQPIYFIMPEVIGLRLTGKIPRRLNRYGYGAYHCGVA